MFKKYDENKMNVIRRSLTNFSRAIRLACVPRFEIIFIPTATGIIEWHAPILRLIKVPSRLLLATVTFGSWQQATIC